MKTTKFVYNFLGINEACCALRWCKIGVQYTNEYLQVHDAMPTIDGGNGDCCGGDVMVVKWEMMIDIIN